MSLVTIFICCTATLYFRVCNGLDTSSTDRFAQLTTTMNALNKTVGVLNKTVGVLNKTIENLASENAVLKQELATVKASNGQRNHAVAFHSVLTKTQNLGPHQTIEFDKVITNIGNAYNSRFGHFTAPLKGIYMFSMTIMSQYGDYIYLQLVKNGVEITRGEGELSDHDTTTEVALVVLDVNDVVWVRNLENAQHSVYGSLYTTFSGCLITAL